MHLVPGFTYRPVANTAGDGIHPIGLVLHVQEGNNSPWGWFNDPSSQASSTLWAGKNGEREQYVPSDVRAWAQGAGNALYCSIETEGFAGEPLTDAQLDTVAAAYADGVRTYGWPLADTDTPGQPGLGTHAMGGLAWGDHPGCPGLLRSTERPEILRRAGLLLTSSAPDLEDIVAMSPQQYAQLLADISFRVRADLLKDAMAAAGPTTPIKQSSFGQIVGADYLKDGAEQSALASLATNVTDIAQEVTSTTDDMTELLDYLSAVHTAVAGHLPAGVTLPPPPWATPAH